MSEHQSHEPHGDQSSTKDLGHRMTLTSQLGGLMTAQLLHFVVPLLGLQLLHVMHTVHAAHLSPLLA